MADITAETIKTILDISRPELHEEIQDVHGIKTVFSTKALHQVKAAPPEEPSIVRVVTLAGFADLIKAGLEDESFSDTFLIHVEDHNTVALKPKISDRYGRRPDLIEASPVAFEQFRFSQWMSQEDFVIQVASRFTDTPDKSYILQLAATLTNEAVMTHEDDGFVQKATSKAGMRTKESVTLKPRVALAPYRTFPEIEQPTSEFVFRARCNGDEKPMLMLVEADGGRWKIDAIATIKKALEAFELNIPIIA